MGFESTIAGAGYLQPVAMSANIRTFGASIDQFKFDLYEQDPVDSDEDPQKSFKAPLGSYLHNKKDKINFFGVYQDSVTLDPEGSALPSLKDMYVGLRDARENYVFASCKVEMHALNFDDPDSDDDEMPH